MSNENSATPQPEPAPTFSEVQAEEAKLYRDLTGDAMALGFDGIVAALEALRATPQASADRAPADGAGMVPDGFVLVPKKITPEMIEAAMAAHYGKRRMAAVGGAGGMDMTVNDVNHSGTTAMRNFWRGALSAAPTAGDSATPQPIYATGGINDIADELEAEALNYEGDFADTVKGCAEALREIAATPQPAGFPERDPSKPTTQQGLFRKFDVRRVDSSDQPGGKHYGCRYFVLDVTHDQHAPAAMRAYGASCASTHPQLAADILAEFGATPQPADLDDDRLDNMLATFLAENTNLNQDGIDTHAMTMTLALNYAALKPVPAEDITEWREQGYLSATPQHSVAEQAKAVQIFTCIGKGGEYELISYSNGAGPKRGESIVVYRDTQKPDVFYHRNADDFKARMQWLGGRAQPLSSTAATQPEQVAPKLALWNQSCGTANAHWYGSDIHAAGRAWRDLLARDERTCLTKFGCGVVATEAEMEWKFGEPSGGFFQQEEMFDRWKEITLQVCEQTSDDIAALAMLAIPASTAASEQQAGADEKCEGCDGKGGWVTAEWVDPISGPECEGERCTDCNGTGRATTAPSKDVQTTSKTAADQQAEDPVVEANRQMLLDRSRVGIAKYGTTLAGAGLDRSELVRHALEEALDLANYLQALLRADPR